MPKQSLERLGGFAAMLGGVAISAYNLTEFFAFSGRPFSELSQSKGWEPFQLVGLVGGACVVFGVVGLYAVQASSTGWAGLGAFVLVLFGVLQYYGLSWAAAFLMPSVGRAAPAVLDQPDAALSFGLISTVLASSVGWIAFAVVTLRGHVFPRWAPILMLLSILASLVTESTRIAVPIGPIGLGIAIAGMGYFLLTRERRRLAA